MEISGNMSRTERLAIMLFSRRFSDFLEAYGVERSFPLEDDPDFSGKGLRLSRVIKRGKAVEFWAVHCRPDNTITTRIIESAPDSNNWRLRHTITYILRCRNQPGGQELPQLLRKLVEIGVQDFDDLNDFTRTRVNHFARLARIGRRLQDLWDHPEQLDDELRREIWPHSRQKAQTVSADQHAQMTLDFQK